MPCNFVVYVHHNYIVYIIVALQFRWECPPLPALSGLNQDVASPCVDPDWNLMKLKMVVYDDHNIDDEYHHCPVDGWSTLLLEPPE